MQKASFSILSYQFDKVELDLSKHIDKELGLSFETNGVFAQEPSQYELIFVVKLGNDELEKPFVIIQCRGVFEFENVNSLDEIPDFFYRNAIAILFPYVRAYLSLVTTQANVPGIILPILNLSDLEEGLRKNTIQK